MLNGNCTFEFSTNKVVFHTNENSMLETMMRRFILLLFLSAMVLVPTTVGAQIYAGIGLQGGFTNMPNANIPINRYNDRAFLYRRMNQFHLPFGEIYEVSFRPDRAIFSLNLNTRRMRATAKSTDAQGIFQRDVRFALQSLSLGAGYAVVDEEKFALYLGASLDAGYMRLSTRTGYTTQINRTNYYLWRRSPLLGVTGFGKMVFRSSRDAVTVYSIMPYVQLPFQNFDFQSLEQLLNQGYLLPYSGPLPARAWNVGVAFNFDLDLIGFLIK